MYDAYCCIFKRCGLDYVIVEAESGEMGGSGSHQFTIPCESGEDIIVYTEDGSYAANLEKAAVDPLPKEKAKAKTPAPEDVHTPNIGTIEDVCAFLKTKPKDMIKTLIYTNKPIQEDLKDISSYRATHKNGTGKHPPAPHWTTTYAVLVRGDHDVNDEKLRIVAGESIELADEVTIQKLTDAKVGFAGPKGLSDRVNKMIIDHAVAAMAVGVTGANKTDYHTINIIPGRDFSLDGDNIVVADVRNSQKLNCKFLDESGKENPCLMGCYGIGINRILASAIETGSDKNGIIFPISIAPFEVLITCVNQDEEDIAKAAEYIYNRLLEKGIEVLLDDREMRGGVKFKDADLIGIPVRITVGAKSLADGNVEIKLRSEKEAQKVALEKAPDEALKLVNDLKQKLNP
jgi:prolyl-tRNA synthetase